MSGARAQNIKDGSERLLDAAGIPLDRMPMLHVVFDRMVAQCSEGLRHFTSSPALFTVHSIGSERIGDILDARALNSVVAVFHAQAWDARILLGVDHRFVFGLVECLFGGDGTELGVTDARPFSNIELHVAQMAFEQAQRALQASFATVAETEFKFERMETRVDFATIAPRTNFGVIAQLDLKVLDRVGKMFVVIPQSALTSIRENLSRDTSNDSAVRDPRWSKQIRSEVSRTEVSVRAVIEEHHFCLEDIVDLEVGQVLKLEATTKSRVKLECNDQALFWCQLGQGEGYYTLRIEESVDKEQEFIDDILPR